MEFSVNVGNIGNISCGNATESKQVFEEYVEDSKNDIGRGGCEDVCILEDGEPTKEFCYASWKIGKLGDKVGLAAKALRIAEQELLAYTEEVING